MSVPPLKKCPNSAKKPKGKVLATRGFMIRAVIDDRGVISNQVTTFFAIQQYDHSLLLETFFRNLLSLVERL